MTQVTKEQIRASVEAVMAIADCIRELGSVPSGELYARICDRVSYDSYMRIIAILRDGKLITDQGHLLRWIGPKKEEQPCGASPG